MLQVQVNFMYMHFLQWLASERKKEKKRVEKNRKEKKRKEKKKKGLIYLLERQRQTEKSSICWFIPQTAKMAREGSSQSQELETPSKTPKWIVGAQSLVPSLSDFPGTLQGARQKQTAETWTKSPLGSHCWRQQFNPLCHNTSSHLQFLR